jgi:hypothetical protein
MATLAKRYGMAVRKPILDGREPEGLDHLGHPEADAVEPDHNAEIKRGEHQNTRLGQGVPERVVADLPRCLGLGFELRLDAGAGPENARAEPEVLVHGERGEPTLTRSRKFTA